MSVAHTLLGLLETGPAHGYTLKHRYDEHFSRTKPLPFGQVYATLSRLDRDGLAGVVAIEHGEGPERKLYRITPEGVASVDSWIYTPEEPGSFATSALLTKTSLALMSARDPQTVLQAQREVHLRRMRELTAAARDAAGLELLGLTYELTHLDADLRWIEQAALRLAADTKAGS